MTDEIPYEVLCQRESTEANAPIQDIEGKKKRIISRLDKLSGKNLLPKTTTIYKKGDYVYFKKFTNSKLDDTWIGPGKVVEVKKNAVIVKRKTGWKW